ncbi:MAG: hypothetical protein ACO22K_11955 [Woeseiaceae bacterium]
MSALENLNGSDELASSGFTAVALPVMIESGSGTPVREEASVPRD